MLIARIYGLLCLLVAAAAVAVYLTGSFTIATTVILGFIASVLAGAGMLVVYPALLTERVSSRRSAPNAAKLEGSAAGKLQNTI
ncbi:MAG: hypothetical protein M3367_13645 [Acidobacteriota bacterium]|nr:hypothetical protein [Acidobacteriota bacterium]